MADPAWSNVVLLLHGEGSNGGTTFVDSSSGGMSITARATETTSTSQFKFGSASIKVPTTGANLGGLSLDSSKITGSTTLTFECFARFDSVASGGPLLAFNGASRVYLAPTGGGPAGEITAYGGSFGVTWTTSGASLVANTWYHIAVVFVPSPGTSRIFIDGVQKASTSLSEGWIDGSTGPGSFVCGNTTAGSAASYYDEVRISKEAVYTANFTPPTAPFPEIDAAVGSASGTGAASAAGKAVVAAIGNSSGAGLASAVGKSTAVAKGSISGVASAAGAGTGISVAVGAASGVASPGGVGVSTAVAAGSATAASTAAAAGLGGSTGVASATSTASAVGSGASTGQAAGVADAQATAVVNASSVGFSVGVGHASAAGESTVISVGLAMGSGSAEGRWKFDSCFPQSLNAVLFGIPVSANNRPGVARGMSPVRFGYPVSFHYSP